MEDKRTEQLSKFLTYVEKQKSKGVSNLKIWSKAMKSKARWSCISNFEIRFYIFGE